MEPYTPIDAAMRDAIIGQLVAGSADVLTIGQGHGLSPEALASWLTDPANAQWQGRLTDAADRHVQLLISLYRLGVVGALLKITDNAQAKPSDIVRAAGMLLEMDLRVAGDESLSPRALTAMDRLRARAEVYGDAVAGEISDEQA